MKKLLLAGMMVAASVASAAVVPTLDKVEQTGSNYTYFYTVGLLADTRLDAAEEEEQVVVIYDFAGYVDGSAGSLSGAWNVTTQLTGPTKGDPGYPELPAIEVGDDSELVKRDNASIVNLVYTYVGEDVIVGPSPGFDTIFASSRFNQVQLDAFRGQGTKNTTNNENGTPAGSSGQVSVPTGSDNPIPEPATMSLLGSALVGLGLLRLRRK